jgi:imidazolonepropionase-like amidohydrolase
MKNLPKIMTVLLAAELALLPSACKNEPAPGAVVQTAASPAETTLPGPGSRATLALVHGTLIDGTGAEPLRDAVVLIAGDEIEAVGQASLFMPPAGLVVIDLEGKTILPGFINAHVHRGFSEDNLKKWAYGGVTTVRDEGTSPEMVKGLKKFMENTAADPSFALLVSAGAMFGAPGGYGDLFVDSPEEARRAAQEEVDDGVSVIKVSQEDGYGGKHDLPMMSAEELEAIVAVAHENGLPVSGHITQGVYIQPLLEAGVDDIAHVPWDEIPPESIRWMVENQVYLTPTFTVYRNFAAPVEKCVENLRAFVEAGGKVALGNDFGGGPGDFERGIPYYEIEKMKEAGMTPMEIIQAATVNAAHVSGLESVLGTLEAGKKADILVVEGDPLTDLSALKNIRMVIHSGEIIRED